MITKEDLQTAIAECEGSRHPDMNTCIKLAALYTVLEHMYPSGGYAYAPAPMQSDSDFAGLVNRAGASRAWLVMDELMDTLHLLQPRLYDAVMAKLT